MKRIFRVSLLFLLMAAVPCTSIISAQEIKTFTVTGTIQDFDGKMIYAKKVDAMGYMGNTVLDSAVVDSSGNFSLTLNASTPLILNFSKFEGTHPIHNILINDPDKYFFGYCAMFYVPEPTLYLTEAVDFKLDWKASQGMDTYTFDSLPTDNHKIFYLYYLQEDISDIFYNEEGDYKAMKPEDAWEIMEARRAQALSKFGIDEESLSDPFKSYMNTEIQLGLANFYLSWYENTQVDQLNNQFATGNAPSVYYDLIKLYNKGGWNTDSVEYFKMTERSVTFTMNLANKKFQKYYPVDETKLNVPMKILEYEVAEKYVENLKKRVE